MIKENKGFEFPEFPKWPEFKVNKNGYEIRAGVLDLAQKFVQFKFDIEYNMARAQFELNGDNKAVFKITIPTVDDVMTAAKKYQEFVNNGNKTV